MAKRLIRWLSRLAPRWRRDDWLREWHAEIDAHPSGVLPLRSVGAGALAHLAWLWSHEWRLDMVRSDVRYALRGMVRTPGFFAAAVMTLALGIGATAAMFSVIDAVLLRSFGFPEIDRVVAVWPRVSVSPKTIHEQALGGGGSGLFESIGAYSGWGFTLTGGDHAESVEGARVTPSLLHALRVKPLHGRLLQDDEDRPGSRVAIVSEGLWRRRFGGEGWAAGKTIEVGGERHDVIGVMPSSFKFPGERSELWLPITIDPTASDYASNFAVRIARLSDGVSVRQAEEQMRAEAVTFQQQYPKAYGGKLADLATVVPLRDHFVGASKRPLYLLLAAVALLLLMACANVGNLMMIRATARRGEMALRAALGADRGRLLRQLFVESLVLAAAGALAGAAIAYGLVRVIQPLAPQGIPNLQDAAVDGRALAVAVGAAVASALLFGVMPGARTTGNLPPLLGSRGVGRPHGASSLRAALVVIQIAIAMLLAVSAALLGRSFVNLTNVAVGFDPERVLTLKVSAPSSHYRESSQVRELYRGLFSRVTALPGVEAAGAIQLLPLSPGNWNPDVNVEGLAAAAQYPSDVNWRAVAADYFAAMRIPLRRGRLIAPEDDHQAMPIAVVNETFARVVFRGADPIGRRIRTGFEAPGVWATIVGIVGDVRQHTLAETSNPEMYRPFAQHPLSTMRIMVKTAGDPIAASATVRAAIAAVDRNVAVSDIEPMAAVVDRALGGTKLPMLLAAALSIVALVVGIVGIGGVISFDVAQRRPEIGIRLALGEPPQLVRRGVLLRAARLGVAGIAAGALGALAAAGVMDAMLYGVRSTDPLTVSLVGTLFLSAILAAAYLPASRASRVDPVDTLRDPTA